MAITRLLLKTQATKHQLNFLEPSLSLVASSWLLATWTPEPTLLKELLVFEPFLRLGFTLVTSPDELAAFLRLADWRPHNRS